MNLFGKGIHLVVAVGFQYVEEDGRDAIQAHTAAVKGYQRILKGRSLGVGYDGVYLRLVLCYRRLEGGQIGVNVHLVKGRYLIRGLDALLFAAGYHT